MSWLWWFVFVLAVALCAAGTYFWFAGFGSSYLRVINTLPPPPTTAPAAGDGVGSEAQGKAEASAAAAAAPPPRELLVSATQLGIASWLSVFRLLWFGAPIVLRQLPAVGCLSWAWWAHPSQRLFWLYAVFPDRSTLRKFARGPGPHGYVSGRPHDFSEKEFPDFAFRSW
jgi:hypothetical protein